jgi:hypothetical protein
MIWFDVWSVFGDGEVAFKSTLKSHHSHKKRSIKSITKISQSLKSFDGDAWYFLDIDTIKLIN